MKYEDEFRNYLATERQSSRSKKPYTKKVIGDIVRRCKAVEAHTGKQLTDHIATSPEKLDRMIEDIRYERYGATSTNPYSYLSLISSVKIYYDFLVLRLNRLPMETSNSGGIGACKATSNESAAKK